MTFKLKSRATKKIAARIIKKFIKKHTGIDVTVCLNAIEMSVLDNKTYLHLDVDMESDDCLSTIMKKLDR